MIPFGVWHEGMKEGTGTWVLAVSGENLLLAGADKGLYWKKAVDCKLTGVHTPEMPTFTAPHPATQQQQVIVPGNGLLKLN